MHSLQPRYWHRLTLVAVAAVGVGLSAFLAVHFSNTQIAERRHQLMVEASTFAGDLEQYLQSREMIAKTVGSVFEAPDLSEPHPLRSVGKKVLALMPEVGVMAWIPQVDPARVHEVLNALSAAGRLPRLYGPNFEALDVTDNRRVLYPVVDVEPKADDNQVGLGMEIGLFPSRKAAFEHARDERRVIATAPVRLLKPFDTTGYILYSPVYNERGFAGCIVFAFGVDQLLNGFAHGRHIPMNFRIYDATDPGQMIVGVTQQGEIQTINSSVRANGAEAMLHSLDFAGRKIVVLFDPAPDLIQAGMQQALTVGGLGLILTWMVLWAIYYFMRSSRQLASEIATTNSMKVSLELVNRELIHRVGNLLAIAQGIIRLSYNASLSTVEFRDSIIARLHALHQSVGLINREDWTGVWLHELLQTELAPVADRINVSGRDVLLKPQAAQSLSLLFYELMTNSSKHGALSKREGTVTAEWEIKDSESGRLFCFRWQEHDHGVIKPPTRQGFGTKLLTRLVPGDLSGRATLNFESSWFRYELEAPVERVVERETNAAVIVKAVFPPGATRGHLGADKLRA
ncbi:MAG TPA: CHASE domain-containing protein [Pseudolabrys sp.]|jgi:two-component sensor histidine kinase